MKVFKFFIFSLVLSTGLSTLLAADKVKAEKRNVANKGACEKEAGKVANGIAKALGQKTSIEQTVLLDTKTPEGKTSGEQGTLETYNVKLKMDGGSSPETTKYWMVRLWDHGEGCSFEAVSLEDAAG